MTSRTRISAVFMLASACFLSACETPTTARYSVGVASNLALKKLGAANVGVGTFSEPADVDLTCRMLGPLRAPDGFTHTQYIKRALEDELKLADAFAQGAPAVTLSGSVEKLRFSSSKSLTDGVWDIVLTLTSSNGQKMTVAERYQFDSGFGAIPACQQTAQAFMPAVQNLITKSVSDPAFAALVR